MTEVSAIIGLRGFGIACARRLGSGRRLVLGDNNAETLSVVAATLRNEGHDVTARLVDITDASSLTEFAEKTSKMGRLHNMVLTAGLSPHMASPERIIAVNLLGTSAVIDTFLPLAVQDTVAVVIASNAGYLAPVAADLERSLALDPPETLLDTLRNVPGADNGLGAYWLSKRGTQLRIEAAAAAWGRKGARIVSVSPGIMATEMSKSEAEAGSAIDEALSTTPMGRIGTPHEIAAAVAWVVSAEARYITGTDLLVDGGMTASHRWAGAAKASVITC
ncbi:SDR family oxidoreductase [Rhizorhabdus argentea]|uniref:SDR family oxidoreductase n=1 Tax=Rhizorhabdus argentea TaxID=1387174 RepID=UPI0030ED21A0